MDCRFCRYSGDKHAQACPVAAPDRRRAEFAFECGRKAGRAGKGANSDNAAYKLGWIAGTVAFEEAQNGCQSWGDD